MILTRTLLALALTSLVALPAATAYLGGGTFVAKSDGNTIVDNGGVICHGVHGQGIGGGCLEFPAVGPDNDSPSFVGVWDDALGPKVAFQVCIDNNGDGICGGPQLDDRCFDQIFFSHDDRGNFFNPLGPLPTSLLPGCGGGFNGYVVLLCSGEHSTRGATPHTHVPTQGLIYPAPFGEGYGDFCGGGGEGGALGRADAVAKAYQVI